MTLTDSVAIIKCRVVFLSALRPVPDVARMLKYIFAEAMEIGGKRSNQSIDEVAASLLDEDKLRIFLDFYGFLDSNKLGKGKTGKSTWAIKYKNRRIGSFTFSENLWSIRYFDLFNRIEWFEKCEQYVTAELKDFILANINTTSSCCVKGACHSVEDRIILGQTFNNRVCACGPIMLIDPDVKTLEYAKELVLIGKDIIAEWRQAV